MQTIENSLLQVSVNENGAGIAHLISKKDNYDYLDNGEKQGKAIISFPGIDRENNWANKLPWTVVDKGDARVSLTLIDSAESYKQFPYHFEIMTTYSIEGTQLNISFDLKNNSNKKMPFTLNLALPQLAPITDESISKIVMADADHTATLESTDLKLQQDDDMISCSVNNVELDGETEQIFKLALTL